MTSSQRLALGSRSSRASRAVQVIGGASGLAGAVACSTAMTLAALGVVGAGAAGTAQGMAGMGPAPAGGTSASGILVFLLNNGPAIIVVSSVLIVLALMIERWSLQRGTMAAFAGALLYWGMYLQVDGALMYIAMAIGTGAWAALLLSARRGRLETSPATSAGG